MANYLFVFLLTCLSAVITFGQFQENLQTNVASFLRPCYSTPEILDRDSKLPMTIDTLIDLIRKIEDGPDNFDLRGLSLSLIARFRQDGIVRAVGLRPENLDGLPYSPLGRPNDKFKLIAKYMVPGNANRFSNDTLTIKEGCSLHSMLSSSIEDWERGDEGTVCSRLGKYRMRIAKRSINPRERTRHISRRSADEIPEDVEIIHDGLLEEKGNIKNPDVERIGQINEPKSDCPVEDGVIYTPYGAVSAGALIAGIAAGSEPQKHIKLGSITEGVKYPDMEIDNLYGATLAGDLAEAALYKNEEEDDNKEVKIGAAGGWNSTEVPRWYFLQQNSYLFLTDAEIRGGLDGMILGNLCREKLCSRVPNLRLSQLLDMYYTRGVFEEKYRACGRRELYKEVAPLEELKKQTTAFAMALDKRVRLRVSLEDDAAIRLSEEAATNLDRYIPSSLSDPNCLTKAYSDSAYTDIIITVDFQAPYKEIYTTLSSILRRLDTNKFTSNYTIVNAYDGTIVVNSTYSSIDFHNIFNETLYNTLAKGIDMVKVIRISEELAKKVMRYEKDNKDNKGTVTGGRSLTALIIPYTDPQISDYVVRRVKEFISIYVPDLRFFVLTRGNKDIYSNIVKDVSRDVVVFVPDFSSTGGSSQLTDLTNRIKSVPRRYANFQCGSDWTTKEGSNQQITQYIAPETTHYYRIHPNYFFGEGSRSIKIKGMGIASLTVCYSRSDIEPKVNQSKDSGDVQCKPITSEEYTISLTDACQDKYLIQDCMPYYFSVSAGKSSEATMYSCGEPACRYPDMIKFTISSENLICASFSNNLKTNSLLLFTLLSTVLFRMFGQLC